MASKVYTANELREYADAMAGDFIDNDHKSVDVTYDAGIVIIECLRQAADAVEENAQLKARLDAVVKECENCFMRVELFRVKMISVSDMTRRHNADINDILRVARGEGGAE